MIQQIPTEVQKKLSTQKTGANPRNLFRPKARPFNNIELFPHCSETVNLTTMNAYIHSETGERDN